MFATNTIKFIDSTLNEKATELEAFENQLNAYKLENDIIDLDAETQQLKDKLIKFDIEKKDLESDKLNTSIHSIPISIIAILMKTRLRQVWLGISEGSLVEGVRK